MTNTFCTYDGNRDELLVAYLYDDLEPLDRSRFAQHLETCAPCRDELDALGAVRTSLATWTTPEPARGIGRAKVLRSTRTGLWRGFGDLPAWARLAAAVLVLGVAAGAANLELRYDQSGLSLRTGWLAIPSITADEVSSAAEAAASREAAAWRQEVAAIERRLRDEFRAREVAQSATAGVPGADDALVRRIRAMVEDSERRQQRELALRVASAVQDVQQQRTADLRRIEYTLGLMESNNRALIVRQDQMLNNLAVRVSQGR